MSISSRLALVSESETGVSTALIEGRHGSTFIPMNARTPNRSQPETGELAEIIRRRNQTSEYFPKYRHETALKAYFDSPYVHVDHGILRGLLRKKAPGTWISVNGGGDYDPRPPSRFITLTHHEEGLEFSYSELHCGCCGHEAQKPIMIPYHLSPEVEFVLSGYTIYPIIGAVSLTRIKSARSATPSWHWDY